MKVIFSHDHIFYKHDQEFYSNGGLSYEVLCRYTDIFGSLTVLSRHQEVESKDKISNLTQASGQHINFVGIPNFKSARSILNYNAAKKKIYEEVRQSDLIIARLPSSISKIVIQAAKDLNKPYLVELVGCAWDANMNHGSFIGKAIAYYEYYKLKSIISNAPYVIYITKEFLQSRYPNTNKNTVCPNVKIKKEDDSILKNRLKKIENSNNIRLGLIGSLDVKYKGHETIIRALSQLKEKNIFIEFLGKGDNTIWKTLAKELGVDDKISFKGSLQSGKAVYEWIDSLDIMIQPSTAEAQGRSIIEGMSRACPIISTRVGGIVELIDDMYLVNKKDYKSLSKKIEEFINDKEKMKTAAIENFEKSKEYYDFSIEKERSNFLECFKKESF